MIVISLQINYISIIDSNPFLILFCTLYKNKRQKKDIKHLVVSSDRNEECRIETIMGSKLHSNICGLSYREEGLCLYREAPLNCLIIIR